MAKLTNFSGGIVEYLDPSKLSDTQAVYITNADINKGSMRNVRSAIQLVDSIQYPRSSGSLYYTRYSSQAAPIVLPQENSVIVVPEDNTTVPPVPTRVSLDNDKLPTGGIPDNLGPRGTNGVAVTGVGDRNGRLLGVWKAINSTGFVLTTAPQSSRYILRNMPFLNSTEGFYSGGWLLLNPKSSERGPWTDLSNTVEWREASNIAPHLLGSNMPLTVKFTPEGGGPSTIFRGSTSHVIPPEIVVNSHTIDNTNNNRGFIAIRVNFGETPESDAARMQVLFEDNDQVNNGTFEVWMTHPVDNWHLSPQGPIGIDDSLWQTNVSFNDENVASYSEPERIDNNTTITPIPTEIVKQSPLTLEAQGLPEGTTTVNGYLYFTRELNTLLSGTAAQGVIQIRGSIADDGSINFLLVVFTGSADLEAVIGQLNPDFTITVPTELPTTGTGPTSRSPANFVGTHGFRGLPLRATDPRIRTSGPGGLGSNSMVIYGQGKTPENTRIPTNDTDSVYNFSISATELQRSNNPARFLFGVVGPHPSPPIITGSSYDFANDIFTPPTGWSLNANIKPGFETWRIIVVLSSSGPTFSTPQRIYAGTRTNLSAAQELAIRVPVSGEPSLDRPLRITVGQDVNQLLAVSRSFHLKDGAWFFGDSDRDYVEYRDELFFTQDVGVPEFINEARDEIAMGIPKPKVEDASISITGSNVPPAWNPVLRQIDIGPEIAANGSPADPFIGIQPFQVVLQPFSDFDQSRIIRTFDTNVGGHEIYNNTVRILPPERGADGRPREGILINHLQVILHVGTSDATLINIGDVNCSNFEFRVWYGSGGGGHGRPSPVFVLNRTFHYGAILSGGSFRRPIWRLGADLHRLDRARDNNRTTTFNRLPKPVPPGNTHSIDWSEYQAGTGSAQAVNYRLGAFIGDQLIRVHNFSISTNARQVQFIISESSTVPDTAGWTYRLYRAYGSGVNQTFNQVGRMNGTTVGPSTSTIRSFIIYDDLTQTTAGTRPAIGAEGNPPAIISSATQYAITNVNETENLESVPTVIDAEPVDNANAFIEITNIPQEVDPRVETRYVYKIDSIYPQWGFIGKLGKNATSFNDNVNFTQSNIYIYNRTTAANTPPSIPEFTSFNTGTAGTNTRQAGQWDGSRFTPPTGWSRERPADSEEGEFVYRSRVTLGTNVSGQTTNYTASYSIPESVSSEGLIIRTGESLNSARNFEPPEQLRYLTLYNNTLFGADGNTMWFSRFGLPHYWPRENFFTFENPITGFLSIQQGLLIFTEFKTYILIGSDSSNFAIGLVSAEQGCINNKTAVFVKGIPLWVSDDGVVSYQNGRVKVLSRFFFSDTDIGSEAWRSVKNAVYWKDVYHVLFGDTEARLAGEPLKDNILCIDFRYELKAYLCGDLGIDTQATPERLGRFDDNKLYMVARTPQGDFRLWELFGSNRFTEGRYICPRLTDGDIGKLKIYDKIYVNFTGIVDITILIDNRPVMTYNCNSLITEENKLPDEIVGEYRNQTDTIRVPQGKSRGYTIQFSITLRGGQHLSELVAISYDPWSRPQDARPATQR